MRHSSQSNFSTRIIVLGVLTREERPPHAVRKHKTQNHMQSLKKTQNGIKFLIPDSQPMAIHFTGQRSHLTLIHSFVCVSMCVQVHICVHIEKPEDNLG